MRTDRRSRRIRRLCRQTTYFSTGVLRMSASLVTPITPLLPLTSKTLDFASATSHDKALLDFFTYNTAGNRAGIVNLNTRNGPVLASIIRGALYMIPAPRIHRQTDRI